MAEAERRAVRSAGGRGELAGRWADDARVRGRASTPARPPYYCLEMFPYPSGRIHMGHVRNYTIGDVIARQRRMRGLRRAAPDRLGRVRPAGGERGHQARRRIPRAWTRDNIAHMRAQLRRLGLSYDWERELATCEPDYYRWEQRFFLAMLERGLAYERRALVNWCPRCQTVLANEQVEDGACWRCDSAGRRSASSSSGSSASPPTPTSCSPTSTGSTGWPEKVLTMQRNWIGRSDGREHPLPARRARRRRSAVFTTRPDTLFGATFVSARAPSIRWSRSWSRGTPARGAPSRRSSRRCGRSARTRARRREGRRRHRAPAAAIPFTGARAADLGRQLRAHGVRHRARSWRCRRTTSATSSSRARTACRCASSCSRRASALDPATMDGGVRRAGHAGRLGRVRRARRARTAKARITAAPRARGSARRR